MCSEHVLTAERAGRLDVYVSEKLDVTRSAAQRLIKTGHVTVGELPQKAGYMLSEGERVEVTMPPPVPVDVLPEEIPLTILYEDKDIAVIDKEQGMVVHPAPGHASGTLVNALLYHLTDLSGVGGELRPGIVHRIDKMTSGLLVVAKNDAAHTALSEQFANRLAHRRYIGIVCGNMKDDAGTVDAPIARHPTDRKRMAVVEGGRDAVTHWQVLERYGTHTLLEFKLQTGRTHQIRVHMASIGHPLAGDDVYGSGKDRLGLAGQALHGYRLAFLHPTTQEKVDCYAMLPPWFEAALRRLGSTLDAQSMRELLHELDRPRA